MNLSNNFTEKEMTETDTGLLNIPTEKEKDFSKLLAIFLLQPIRDRWGWYDVTSWYRSAWVNRKVGGSATSQHRKGQAADGRPKDADVFEVYNWIVSESGLEFGQCIIYPEEERPFIHISLPRLRKANGQAFIKYEGKYLPYSETKLNEIVGG